MGNKHTKLNNPFSYIKKKYNDKKILDEITCPYCNSKFTHIKKKAFNRNDFYKYI